ncbi:MAG TPA: aldehyde dehydrogenase (NADP(+)) [Vicinamibacterales bacterium]|nr:aldehyde dehydrogenase (NADP(+)) [Vicinamibacterales bacterium]
MSNRQSNRQSAIGNRQSFRAVNPRTGEALEPAFAEATLEDVGRAAAAAASAFRVWSRTAPDARARVLRAAAENLEADRERIVATADLESGLGTARLSGELDRTTGQIRMFAALIEEGSFVDATISHGDPDARPLPRPDVRRLRVPLGPVAVVTPSNFPLAFGAAGGDTASALAAGCPVVVKGHASHPGTSALCAAALDAAAAESGAPEGLLSLLQARATEIPAALVRAPEVQAVAFTGSRGGGRALLDIAAARPQPIPVYAEMGSLNPLFIGPSALAARADAIADGLAASIVLGTGQFCTKPGLVFVPDDHRGVAFAGALAARVAAREAGPLLNAGIAGHLAGQAARTAALPAVQALAGPGETPSAGYWASGMIVSATVDEFLGTPALQEEHFGPFAVVIRCPPGRMPQVAATLEGSLTATVHAEGEDLSWAAALEDVLRDRAGRLVWNGYPTGVAVVDAMHHGGPYPACSSPLFTSVGTAAIARFLRPVAYQNVPEALLPEALRESNPLRILRRIDGRVTRAPHAD